MDVGFENEWFLANVRRTGVYRVNYDQKNWELLIHQLNTDHTVCTSLFLLGEEMPNIRKVKMLMAILGGV